MLDSGRYCFRKREVEAAFEITREVFAGHFDNIREKYKDVRLGYELLRMIGKISGAVLVYREFHMSEEEILNKLHEKFSLTPEEAEKYLAEK